MTSTPKLKRKRLSTNKELLKKLVSLLEREKLTKEELAVELELDNPKQINDSLLLAAAKISGNTNFLANILEKGGGRAKKGPQYSVKKGVIVPAWLFEGKEVEDGQKYEMKFGDRTGKITLIPID